MNLADLVRSGRLAIGLGAVVLAGLAARLLRVLLRRAFGEGRGLALAVALGLLQLAGQAFDLCINLCEAALEVGDDLVALPAAKAERGIHTVLVARKMCRRGGRMFPRRTKPLINYDQGCCRNCGVCR
jgi:hypothetical protein